MPLTRCEYGVLLHVAYSLSNREMGFSLSISIETVGGDVWPTGSLGRLGGLTSTCRIAASRLTLTGGDDRVAD